MGDNDRARERKFGRRKTARGDDRARPVAIISLAATRQMSEHCETRRLVGRFALAFAFSCFRNNITPDRDNNARGEVHVC